MLKVFSNSASDNIDKILGLIQALAKKGFEYFLGNGNVDLIFLFPLLLLLIKQGGIFEKDGGKWHLILTFGLGSSKMVLTLLKEVIALLLSFILMYVWESGLPPLFIKAFVLLKS